MATLEAIRGGGGSVKVGTVGTISSLMTRELESSKYANSPRVSHVNVPLNSRKSMDEASSSSSSGSSSKQTNPEVNRKSRGHKPNRAPVLSVTTPKRPKQKTPLEDVGNNTVRQEMSKKSPNSSKTRSKKSSSQIPMLGSENIHLEKTPVRIMPMKKGLNIVDVVDIRCGTGNPSISDRLRKLGFSKLSRSFM